MSKMNNCITFEEYQAIERMTNTFKKDHEKWIKEKENFEKDQQLSKLKEDMNKSMEENDDFTPETEILRDSLLGVVQSYRNTQLRHINDMLEQVEEAVNTWTSILHKVQMNFELSLDLVEFEKVTGKSDYVSRLTTANSLIQVARLINREDSLIGNDDVLQVSEFMNDFMTKALN